MLFWWFVLAVFWFVVDDDGFLDYVQVLHQFSFVALNQQTASRINLEINAFAMPLSVLNDLAEAMKALEGKKRKGIRTSIWKSYTTGQDVGLKFSQTATGSMA